MTQPLNERIRAAIVQVADCIDAIDIHQAFADAVYDSRVTQYGNAVATRSALISIRSQLQALLPPGSPHSMGTPASRLEALPLQQDAAACSATRGCTVGDAA